MLLIIACATPIGPTGGPRDTSGPVILETEPTTGTTNFDGRTFRFHFNEYIQRSSLSNNINVEPDLGLTYSTKWKKKRLTIEFDSDLPDSTTIIVTLGGNIEDTKRNKMGAPATVAISTGDEIDESSVAGKLKSADDGTPLESEKVLLYREPFDFSERATYQAETDTGGVFRFSYLGPGTYTAIYLEDRNRNKIWEEESELAQPFFVDFIEVQKRDTVELEEIYIQRPDTIAPELQAVGMLSDRRLRLRFNEDVELTDSLRITVLDSLQNPIGLVDLLYRANPDAFVVYAISRQPLLENSTYSLAINGIEDAAGNEALTNELSFLGSSQEDTTLQRVISVDTESGLFPAQSFEVTYAAPIVRPEIIDSVVVIEGDVDFDNWPPIRAINNKLFISPQETWIDGLDYQFLIWNPVTQRRAMFQPEVWDSNELGGVEIRIMNPDSTAQYLFTLENEEYRFGIDSVMTSNIEIENLAPLNYQLRLFKDENGNGEWDRGSVIPYRKPEPIFIRSNLSVRTGFTSEVIIEF